MRIVTKLQSFFKTFDLFSTSQFLRYQEEGEYKTASGGICSLMVIIIFGVLFMNTAIQTINMDIINWTSTQELLYDPKRTEVTVYPRNNKFMFAGGVLGVDLNNATHRFFDVDIYEVVYSNGNSIAKNNRVPMVPCTKEHFAVDDTIQASFDNIPAKTWMCPPLNYTFPLSGKYTSHIMEVLQIKISKCNDSLDLSRPCVPDATINFLQNMIGQFIFTFYYANPLINPGSKDYLSYYLEDKNYVTFTTELGAYSNGFVQEYSIQTDMSLLPFTQTVKDEGITIPDLFQTIAYQVTSDQYASFFLIKSSSSTSYNRSFNKLDSFFSYVGGLVGTILGFMLIVKSFTQMSFELSLSERLFSYSQNPPNRNFNGFNFLTYLLYLIYSVLNLCGLCSRWEKMNQYVKCREQIVKQLDVQLLLHRFDFMERALDVIFNDSQVYGLHLQRIQSLNKLQDRRRRYSMRGMNQNNGKVANAQLEDLEQQQNSEDLSKSEKSSSLMNHQIVDSKQKHKRPNETIGFGLMESNLATLRPEPMYQSSQVAKIKRKQIKRKEGKNKLDQLIHQVSQGNAMSKKIAQGIDPDRLEERDDERKKKYSSILPQIIQKNNSIQEKSSIINLFQANHQY